MLDVARSRPVTASSWDIQSARAIAGDMRIKACWVALHAFSRAPFALKSLACSESAALSAVSVRATHMMLLSGQFLTPH